MLLHDFLLHATTDPDLRSLIECVARGAAEIAEILACAEIRPDVLGAHEGCNATGDTQQKVDVLADRRLLELLRDQPSVAWIGSEEQDQLVPGSSGPQAQLLVTYDPLDGSSNLSAHIPTGTIFGIWRTTATLPAELPSGHDLIASGYVLYSRAVVLTASVGGFPFMATLDPTSRQWIVTRTALSVPDKLACYSLNEANIDAMDPVTQGIIRGFHGATSLRYVGSMVADIHRNLLYGGVFSYPADRKNPDGKLRYFYECAPLAWLYEKAGGRAFDGRGRLLDARHTDVHARCPIYIGSPATLQAIETAFAANHQARG